MSDEHSDAIPDISSLKSLLQQAASRPTESFFKNRLSAHFETMPETLPVVMEEFETSEHPNLHSALTDYLEQEGRSCELLGIAGGDHFIDYNLSQLVTAASDPFLGQGRPEQGPVQYVNIHLEGDHILPCVRRGLYLIRDRDLRFALLVRGPNEMRPHAILVEVMAIDQTAVQSLLAELRGSLRRLNVYRGHVVSLTYSSHGAREIRFHRLPKTERDQIILPEGLLERIERQTIGFSKHSQKMLAAGRHLKRGILLHGPPGTGKTLTAMYLASQMRERTILLLTGRGLGLIGQSCQMARILQPSTVILEDVDLVAEERTARAVGCHPLLFELLNEMDGLPGDADIIFLLTSNRPDLLEPALASRPGRVDQAIALPLPDADGRRRLFDLYGRGLALRLTNTENFVQRTEGASPAFIRELLRRAALFAAEEGGEFVVEDRHLEEALRELVICGDELTKSLLGMRSPSTASST